MLTRDKRRLVRNILICGAASLLILFVASLFSPFYHEVCEKNQYTGHNDCATYHIAVGWLWYIGKYGSEYGVFASAGATIAIAIFTWTLWGATVDQGRLTQQSIELARAEFNATHRPHLVVRDISVDGDNVIFLLINKGDAPCTIIESWVFLEHVSEDQAIRPMLSAGHDDLGNIHLAVGEIRQITWPAKEFGFFFRFPEAGRPEKNGDMTRFIRGEFIHFAMTIVYADLTGQRRRSVYRRRWNPDKGGFYRLDDPDQEYSD